MVEEVAKETVVEDVLGIDVDTEVVASEVALDTEAEVAQDMAVEAFVEVSNNETEDAWEKEVVDSVEGVNTGSAVVVVWRIEVAVVEGE